jgi:hypothetical protein
VGTRYSERPLRTRNDKPPQGILGNAGVVEAPLRTRSDEPF